MTEDTKTLRDEAAEGIRDLRILADRLDAVDYQLSLIPFGARAAFDELTGERLDWCDFDHAARQCRAIAREWEAERAKSFPALNEGGE